MRNVTAEFFLGKDYFTKSFREDFNDSDPNRTNLNLYFKTNFKPKPDFQLFSSPNFDLLKVNAKCADESSPFCFVLFKLKVLSEIDKSLLFFLLGFGELFFFFLLFSFSVFFFLLFEADIHFRLI